MLIYHTYILNCPKYQRVHPALTALIVYGIFNMAYCTDWDILGYALYLYKHTLYFFVSYDVFDVNILPTLNFF